MTESTETGRKGALVTGATGFVGRALIPRLDRPKVLSRDAERAKKSLPGVDAFTWADPEGSPPPAEAFEGVDVVFHLAGEPVADGRWTEERRRRIHDSRRLGTRRLVEGIAQADARPSVLVSASAVGIYGDRGEDRLDETSAHAMDFLGKVCHDWELEAIKARRHGVRVACMRLGIVLGKDGGALEQMLRPFKMGVGGPLGFGRQWMPWVHRDDVVGLLLHAADSEAVSGPVNTTAPDPARNRDFTKVLARVLRRPAIFPVPPIALRILFGEFADVLLGSQRTVARVATETGYEYRHPDLEAALRDILD